MKIDSMLKLFVENYSKESIEYIDNMKNNFGRVYRRDTINLFTVTESCNTFNTWIKGYTAYCIEETKKGDKPTLSVMREAFNNLMNSKNIFCESAYTYDRIPSFIEGYINGINNIIGTINESISLMLENDVDQDLIGALNEFTDKFTDTLQESFTPAMDKLLLASGWISKNKLMGNNISKKKDPIFL